MTPERWQEVKRALDGLLSLQPEPRQAELARLRRQDEALAAEVESLLRQQGACSTLDVEGVVSGAWRQVQDNQPARGAGGRAEELPAQVGPYRVQERIGQGGMGAVYRVEDRLFRRRLAVKVLAAEHGGDADLKRRFLEEAQLTGRLQHPGVPPVHDRGELADGRPYFAMKLIQGTTLAQLLAERSSPEQGRPHLLGIFLQVCQTLAYAHEQGVIHRDLKPANIMVGAFGEVQVMDWGLAKTLDRRERQRPEEAQRADAPLSGEPGSTICPTEVPPPPSGADAPGSTLPGSIVGTLGYMPPEQARGEVQRLDARADVFGLGAILCAILTGRPPFSGLSCEALCQAQCGDLGEAFARLDGCGADAELLALARRCLAPQPEGRPADAGALAAELTAYLESVEARLRQAELERAQARGKAAEERRRRRAQLGLAAALLLLAAVGGGLAWWRWRAEREADAVLQRAQGLLDRGWQEQDLATLKEARAEGERAAGIARSTAARDSVRRQVAAFRARAEQRLERLEKNRALLAALLDVAAPQETRAYRRAEAGQMVLAPAQPSLDEQYAAAFRRHWGLDVDGTPEADVVARVRQEPDVVVEGALAALDAWMLERRRRKGPSAAPWRRLFRITDSLDRSGQRRRLRALLLGEAPPQAGSVVGLLAAWPPWPSLWELGLGRGWRALRELQGQVSPRKEPVLTVVLLAQACEAVGDTASAEQALRLALAEKPDQLVLLDALGRLLDRQGPARLGEAIECYRAIRARDPRLGLALGRALTRAGRAAEGEAVCRDLVRQQPASPEMHFGLGLALHLQGKRTEAERAYAQAIRLGPADADARNNLGVLLPERKKLPEAEEAFRQAIQLNPGHPLAHNNLSQTLCDQGKTRPAEEAARRAIRLKPDYHEAHTNLGFALYEQKRLDEAVAAFRQAIRLEPDAEAYTGLGAALQAQGKSADAEGAFRKALRFRPSSAALHFNLGKALRKQDRLVEAEAAYRRAMLLEPNDADTLVELGLVLEARSQFGAALALLTKGSALLPPSPRRDAVRRRTERCQRWLALDGRLPAVLRGEERPASAAEQLEFARLCALKKLYAAAARCHREAFAAAPELAEDVQSEARYVGACVAALAGCGQGKDADKLDDEERALWRRQALDWLRADLAEWSRRADRRDARADATIQKHLRHWQGDADFAGVRDREALARLSEAERRDWQRFWADVAALRKRAQGPPRK